MVFIGSIGIIRRNCLVLGRTKPICTPNLFLRFTSHLNEYFQCSHSLYFKTAICVSLNLSREEPGELLLPIKATSVSPHLLSPASGSCHLPCFCSYSNHLFSEGSWPISAFSPAHLQPEVPFSLLSVRLQGAFQTRVAGWVAVENWLVSFTSSGGPPSAFSSFFFFFFPEGLKSAGLSWKRYQSSRFPDVTLRPWWGRGWTERGLVYLCGSECFQLCLLLAKPNLCLQTTLIVWALFLVLVFPFSVPSPSHLSNHTALLWLFCSDPWGMDSMNLIGCLVYGVYDLENFVSPGLGYTKILIKKKNLWQRGLNVFVSVIANSWFLALCIKETFLSSVVSKASG